MRPDTDACKSQSHVALKRAWWSFFSRTWNRGSMLQGPWTLQLANMAGECRAVQGFRETSLLVHLRRSAAEVFSTLAGAAWSLEMRCGLPTGWPGLRR